MRDRGLYLYRGEIWFKDPHALCTKTRCCPVKEFVTTTMGNTGFIDILDGKEEFLVKLLADPKCAVLPQIEIDMDTIEVRCQYCYYFYNILQSKRTIKHSLD